MRIGTGVTIGLLISGCGAAPPWFPAPIPVVDGNPRSAFALEVIDIQPGIGAAAEPARCYYVHYTGWLTNGTKFDSSRDTTSSGAPRTPISFPQGFRRVITGWDTGFEGMQVGGKRRLIIPYQLAYGAQGRPPLIPPKATLIFDVELMAVADTLPRADASAERGTAAATPRCTPWPELAARTPP